jgi:tetratricopeptide (TPR) repeat protein
MVPEMLEAFVAALGGGLATRAGEGAAAAASQAWSALVRTVRGRLGGDSRALAEVERGTAGEATRAALLESLRRAVEEDPGLAALMTSWWQGLQITGSGNSVVQGGRDVTVNYLPLPAGPPPVPREVPPFIGTFVNRTAELEALGRRLVADRSAGAAMVMLVGLPGMGKSALAQRWVGLQGDRFPGGHLHIDYATLSGRSGGAAVSTAMAKALRSLGVPPGVLPGEPGALADEFRSRTAGREPMLVVLENVTDYAQVASFVPAAAGSAVVLTGEYELREVVRKGAARVIKMSPLPEAEAVALLTDLCGDDRVGDEPEAARAVVRWCGALPEALRVAGARLATEPWLTAGKLADELADEATRLEALSLPGWAGTGVDDSVAAAFAVSYGRLPAEAQALYRALGAARLGDCTAELAAAITAIPGTRALRVLADASLVTQYRQGRYRMHTLVRLHAAQVGAVDGPAVLARLTEHYLVFTAWADKAIMGDRLDVGGFDPSGRPDPFGPERPDRRREALDALEAERENLLVVVRAAAEAGMDEAVWQLALALPALYLNHRHLADWIETGQLGAQAAQRQARHDVVARIRSMTSRPYQDRDDLPAALTEVEAALEAVRKVGGKPALVASVHEMHGRILQRRGRPAEAEAAYRTALALNVEAGEGRGEALVRYFLGDCLLAAGRREEGLALLAEAGAWLADRDVRMAARCRYSLGRARLEDGDLLPAGRDLRAAADTFAGLHLWHYEVPAREALADLAKQLDDREGERRELSRALAVEEGAGGRRSAALRERLLSLGDAD